MNRLIILGLFIICVKCNNSFAQTVDLTSVDEFFKVTSTIKDGKEISEAQWDSFNNSTGYRKYADRENKFVIGAIKASIQMAFGKSALAEKDSILGISKEAMTTNRKLMFKKRLLANYIDINENYESIKSFKENYDFNALVENSKQRLFTFLEKPLDTTFKFKCVYFFCMDADGGNEEDAVYIDLNLIYKMTEKERINFLAHELFHNYREKYENNFRAKCDLNAGIDMLTNEGIADMIDKTNGYEKYYTTVMDEPELAEIMVELYKQAREDLEILHNYIIKYSKSEITETQMIDKWLEIAKFNGHAIGFFMANQIVTAGYKHEILGTFYNPYTFFSIYNKAAKELNIFQFSDEFMAYLKKITQEYYR